MPAISGRIKDGGKINTAKSDVLYGGGFCFP